MRQFMNHRVVVLLIAVMAAFEIAAAERYTIKFHSNEADASAVAARYGATVERSVNDRTLVVTMPKAIAQALLNDPRVLQIVATDEPVDRERLYSYDADGNITSIGADTFAYDSAGRIVRGTVSGQEQHYSYDAFGNRVGCDDVTNTGDCQFTATIDSETNRIDQATYDDAGNLRVFSTRTFAYDEVGMLVRGPGITEYVYNAADERIARVNGSSWSWTLRDPAGRMLREVRSTSNSSGNHFNWTWTRDSIYRGSTLLATVQPEGKRQYHVDHLGTPRLVTAPGGAILGIHDYFPFGLELESSAIESNPTPLHFTGHERDGSHPESLDYMRARYYSAAWGRFLSVDPADNWNPREPQSWNRYSYTSNNPMRFIDPDGRSKTRPIAWVVKYLKGRHVRVRPIHSNKQAARALARDEQVDFARRQTAVAGQRPNSAGQRPVKDPAHPDANGSTEGRYPHAHAAGRPDGVGHASWGTELVGFVGMIFASVTNLDADPANEAPDEWMEEFARELASLLFGKDLEDLTQEEWQTLVDVIRSPEEEVTWEEVDAPAKQPPDCTSKTMC